MKLFFPLVCICLAALVYSGVAYSEDFLLSTQGKEKINGLSWNRDDFKIQTASDKQYIILSGFLNKPKWTLVYRKVKIPLDAKGKFLVRMPVATFPTQFGFEAVSPFGDIEKENFRVDLPKGSTPTLDSPLKKKSWALSGGVGYSSLKYEQTNLNPLTQTAITPKLAYTYFFSPQWDLAGSAFYSALVLSSSYSSVKASFLGLNSRIGYYPQFVKSPFRLGILFGFYFTTMLVSGDDFGFRNLSGPQLFPTLRYTINPRHAVAGYFKFSPVSSGFSLLTLSNREIAFGTSYVYTLKNGDSIAATLDVATLNLAQGTTQLVSNSTTFGLGYTF